MDPAVDADLVPRGDDAALLVGVDQRRDRRHVECCLDAVAFEQFQDARHATRAPYWPHDIRPIDLPPSRSSLVS